MRYTTQFLLSALAAAQFPAPSVPEIAFLGRSNVGKSSLLNELVGEKAAKVSQTPGRTRAINFFALLDPSKRPQMIFADLPGYGYAKISKSISAGWSEFIDPYLAERPTLKSVCLPDRLECAGAGARRAVAGLADGRGTSVRSGGHQVRPVERQRADAQPGGAEKGPGNRRDPAGLSQDGVWNQGVVDAD
jgi:hypothetical protein